MYYLPDVYGEIVKTNNDTEYLRWFRYADRQIAYTRLLGISISTVALGIDYNHGIGEPHIFETMIFGGYEGDYCVRYSTIAEAKEGHKRAVRLVLKTLPKSLWGGIVNLLKTKEDEK